MRNERLAGPDEEVGSESGVDCGNDELYDRLHENPNQ